MAHPPVIVTPTPPSVDVGTTAFFTPGSGSQSIVRARFPSPRQMTLYVYWDPQKNNPQSFTSEAVFTQPFIGRQLMAALGTIEIGMQQTITSLNFDIPYQQLLAIPITCDYVQVSARIVAPFFGEGAGPTPPPAGLRLASFQNPANLIVPPANSYPNVTAQYPRGFVAISGMLGEGTLGGRSSTEVSNLFRRTQIWNIPTPGTEIIPVAWGATHVAVYADRTTVLPGDLAVRITSGAPGVSPEFNVPINVNEPMRLPITAEQIIVVNLSAHTIDGVEVVQYLGL